MQKYTKKIVLLLGFLFAAGFLFQLPAFAFQVKKGKATLAVTFRIPKGYEFAESAPFALEWKTADPNIVQFTKPAAKDFSPFVSPYKIQLKTHEGQTTVTLKADLYYCGKTVKLCFKDTFQTQIPLEVASQGSSTVLYTWDIKPRRRPPNTLIPLKK